MPMTKNIGNSISSQKRKKRKRSIATSAPSMPHSSTSMKTMNSLVRCLMSLQLASNTTGVSSVVRSTSQRENPSTPREYLTPRLGIHSTDSTSWSVPMRGSNRPSMTSERRNGTSEKAKAVRRGTPIGSDGTSRSRSPKAKGDQRMRERMGASTGKPFLSAEPVVAQHDDRPDDHAERVVLDVPGLQPAPQERGGRDGGADAIHGAVNQDGGGTPPEDIARCPVGPEEQRLVDLIDPVLVPENGVESLRPSRDPSGEIRPPNVQQPRPCDACERDRGGDDHQEHECSHRGVTV